MKRPTDRTGSGGSTPRNNRRRLAVEAKELLGRQNDALKDRVHWLLLENAVLKQQIDQLIRTLGADGRSLLENHSFITLYRKEALQKAGKATQLPSLTGSFLSRGSQNTSVKSVSTSSSTESRMQGYMDEICQLKVKIKKLEGELVKTRGLEDPIRTANGDAAGPPGENNNHIAYVHQEFLDLKRECDAKIASLRKSLGVLRSLKLGP